MKFRIFFTILTFFLCPFLPFAQADVQKNAKLQKNVLLIMSYDMEHEWTAILANSVLKGSRNIPFDLKIDTIELNAIRKYDEREFQKKLNSRANDIRQKKYDLIITLDDIALDTLIKNRQSLKLTSPVVFAGYEKSGEEVKKTYRNLTGVTQIIDVEKTIKCGLKLCPDTKKILAVYDASTNSRSFESRLKKIKIDGLKIEILGIKRKSVAEIYAALGAIERDTLVFVFPWMGILENDYQSTAAFALDLGRATKHSYFVCDFSMFGYGALGGYLTDPAEHGKDLISLIEKTLRTGNAEKITITSTAPRAVFDWRIIEREKLNVDKLPYEAIIKNRPIGFFDINKTQVIAALLAFAGVLCAGASHMYLSHRIHKRTMEFLKSHPGRLGVFDEHGNILFFNSDTPDDSIDIKHVRDMAKFNCNIFAEEAKIVMERSIRRTFEYVNGNEHRVVVISPLPEHIFKKKTAVWISADNTELSRAREAAERLELENSAAQARYRRAARLWSIVIDTLPSRFFVKDADSNFRYVLCNSAFANFAGLKKEDIIGKNDREITEDSERAQIFEEQDKRIMMTSHGEKFKEYQQNAAGEIRCLQTLKLPYVDEDGDRMLICMSTDVTELNALYKTQIAMTQCLERILANKDGKAGASFALKVLCEQTEADKCAILKLNEDETLSVYREYSVDNSTPTFADKEIPEPPTDSEWTSYDNLHTNPSALGEKWQPIIEKIGARNMRVFRVDADGKKWGYIFIIYTCDSFVEDEEKKKAMRSFANFIEVIIEREYAKSRLLSALEQAREANKAKSYFIASVSHEIRTPLNSVIGFSELLRDAKVSDEERKQYLESIVFGGNALLQLVNDVLDLSKLEAGRIKMLPELCDFKEIADGVAKLFALKAAEKNIDLKLEIPPSIPPLVFDKMRIRQILLNLVGNAVKFTSVGGVRVWAKFEKKDAKIGQFTFGVTDTGEGVAKENIPTIMDPFMQFKNARDTDGFNQGTGLGLPISKRLAEKMGGTLWLESELSKGSTFGVTIEEIAYGTPLPLSESIPTSTIQEVDKKISILIVDDVQMNLSVLKAMCNKTGISDVETASNGIEALEILSKRDFSLVLTDLWMPKMSGEEFAREVRKNNKFDKIPIVAVTADIEARDNFDVSAFSGVLLKPITIAKIKNILLSVQDKSAPIPNELEKS